MDRSGPRPVSRGLAHVRRRSGVDDRRLRYAGVWPTCWPAWSLVTNRVSRWARAAQHVHEMPSSFPGYSVAHRIGRFCHAPSIRLVGLSLLWSCDPLVFADWYVRKPRRPRVAADTAASEFVVTKTSLKKVSGRTVASLCSSKVMSQLLQFPFHLSQVHPKTTLSSASA